MSTKEMILDTGIPEIDQYRIGSVRTLKTGIDKVIKYGDFVLLIKNPKEGLTKLYSNSFRFSGYGGITYRHLSFRDGWVLQGLVTMLFQGGVISEKTKCEFENKYQKEILDEREVERIKELKKEARQLGFKVSKKEQSNAS